MMTLYLYGCKYKETYRNNQISQQKGYRNKRFLKITSY